MAKYTQKSKQHAEKTLKELEKLFPQLEDAWKQYVNIYVEFENKRRLLEVYAIRGIIDKEAIPKIKHKSLLEELKEYRKQRK